MIRRIPLTPILLIIALGAWLYNCDRSDCLKAGHDLSVFAQAAGVGKLDGGSGGLFLDDVASAFVGSYHRTLNTLHLGSAGALVSDNQDHAVVLIKGDKAEGTGFLVRMPDGPVVITNLHVISGNQNFHILTDTGGEVKFLSLKGASDRDIAMFQIQDQNYHYLNLDSDISESVQAGDDVITPGDSEGGEVTLNTEGKVLGVGPERVEISNPIYHGNSGGPVVEKGSGQVVGVVAFAQAVQPSDFVDKASMGNPGSAIVGDVRYFALRLDTVPEWEPYDVSQFLQQSSFLDQFHEDSRCLDSLINGAIYEKAGLTSKGAPDSKYYLHNQALRGYTDPHLLSNIRKDEELEEARVVIIDCMKFAGEGLDVVQNPGGFYSYERKRAKEESDYRRQLLAELKLLNDKI